MMMKSHHSISLIFLCLISLGIQAQDTLRIKDPTGKVLLEVRKEGVLVQKMTTAQRTAVSGLGSNDNGLLVYDMDAKSLWLWHDSAWLEIDGTDLVDDADHDPTNELQTWSTLPGIPSGFSDGTDNVDDADHDPMNEKNLSLSRNGTNLELTDAGGTLTTGIGWAIGTSTVFNNTDNVGIGTDTPLARFHVQNGALLLDGSTGATPVSGAGSRMMWVPAKNAFRAGAVSSTQWDDSNIGLRSFVGGGTDNKASAFNSIVAGGGQGSATADRSFVGGGFNNTASGINAFVSGGASNTASGLSSFTGGGLTNTASGQYASSAGGTGNISSGWSSMVAGGGQNSASSDGSFVGGGIQNISSGGVSFVAGGLLNTASGYASFASGRENNATGNHAFAAGYGLSAKSFGEAVFGSYNTDYTPASTTGFANSDRLFTIGNGQNASSRSDALTVLKNGNVGIGTNQPNAGLQVTGNKGLGEHIMLIENLNHEGSGLKIKINGSHPLWVQGAGNDPDFFITRPVSALETLFEDVAGDIRDYLLSEQGISFSNLDLSQINSPAGLIDQLGLTDFMSGGLCKGVETLVDLVNSTALAPIQLPDLPLNGVPQDIPDFPSLPTIPAIPNFVVPIPNPQLCLPSPLDCYTINIPDVTITPSFISNPVNAFNSAIGTVNTGISNVNNTLETGYDQLKSGLTAIDDLEIPLPQLQVPQAIGPVTCPNPNPWDNINVSFEKLNPLDYNILNPLSGQNEFITFVDAYNNKLGAIKGQSIGEFNQDYFKLEKVLEIGGAVVGLFSDDGSMVKNGMKLVKEAVNFYKAADKIGVEYSSGHGDYAEWLERENPDEQIGYGDIIGIRGGRISRSLDHAEQVMVVSKAPIVLGNIPDPGKEKDGNDVAFIGQVPVKVMGPVRTGDYIIGNPATPGFGVAIAENEITPEQLSLAVGKSWETDLTPGFKFINTIVGMLHNAWTIPVINMQQRLNAQESMIDGLAARLDKLEGNTGLMAGSNGRKR